MPELLRLGINGIRSAKLKEIRSSILSTELVFSLGRHGKRLLKCQLA